MNKVSHFFRYYLLAFISFLLRFIGIIGIRLLTIFVCVLLVLQLEKYIGKLALTVGWILSLIVFGLLMILLERIYPYLEKLDDYAKSYKRFPYIEKYGSDYPKPNPEDFGISQDEFKEYNGRFQFEFIKVIFTYGLCIASSIYFIKAELPGNQGIFLIGGVAAIAVILNYLFEYWNKKISQKHRYYKKIKRYQEAVEIYYNILREKLGV